MLYKLRQAGKQYIRVLTIINSPYFKTKSIKESNKIAIVLFGSNKINTFKKIYPSMRPQSQRAHTRPKPKLHLPNKNKNNTQGNQTLSHQATLKDRLAKDKPQLFKHHHTQCNHYEEQAKRTATELSQHNFSHHNTSLCLCKQCHCGRHMCKMHVLKPNLTKKTHYQHAFFPKQTVPCIVVHAKEYKPLKGPHLDMRSTYGDGYTGGDGDQLERPKPQDILRTEGPAADLTSYASEFPGHRGSNQYIRRTDRYYRGYFPFRSKSTYSEAFGTKSLKKDDYKYISDQLKTGSNWLGTTTYNNVYGQPDPEYMASPVKNIEKREAKPSDRLRFKTTYSKDYDSKTISLCPAKIYLQTHDRQVFDQNKAKFSQNSDFKTLSKHFQGFATSKHSFI